MLLLIPCVFPAILLILGLLFVRRPPRQINSWVGYRTERSARSPEAWREANAYSAQLMVNLSWAALGLTLGVSLLLGEPRMMISLFLSLALMLAVVITVLVKTERRLKVMFGE